jgi:diguanylate cyclase (GGDEF)-like protein
MTGSSSPADAHPFDRVEDILFILDSERRFTFLNAFALKSLNKQPQELLGHKLETGLLLKSTPEIKAAFLHALRTQERTEFDTFGLRNQVWINVTLYPDRGGLIVLVKPLPRHSGTALPADHDALTGCLTRAAFQAALQTFPLPYVLAIIDLNLLKSVNTLRGHSGGDTHIRTVAHALREALPPEALICRWGGDEFVILALGDDDALQKLLDETNARLPQPLPNVPAFTVGLAVREQGTAYERAFALADEQLELRKEQLRQSTPADREADSLVTFSQELEALRDPGDLIDHALKRLLVLLNFDQATYTNIEGDNIFNSHHAYREGVPVPQPELNVRSPLARTGLVQIALRTRLTEWSTDYPNTPNRMQNVVDQGVKTVLVTPVFSQGRVVATLVLRAVNRWQTITPHLRRVVELTALRLEHALELRRERGS